MSSLNLELIENLLIRLIGICLRFFKSRMQIDKNVYRLA